MKRRRTGNGPEAFFIAFVSISISIRGTNSCLSALQCEDLVFPSKIYFGPQPNTHNQQIKLGEASAYGLAAYTARIINAQGNNPNPMGYDWKYPLAKADNDFGVLSTQAAANLPGTVTEDDRIMCLTCHKAHATRYANMTRWDTNAHAFIADGRSDFTGTTSEGDNPAFGCGKCHQMGGVNAFVKSF